MLEKRRGGEEGEERRGGGERGGRKEKANDNVSCTAVCSHHFSPEVVVISGAVLQSCVEEGTEDVDSVSVFLCQQLIIQVPEREGGEVHGVREGGEVYGVREGGKG